MKLVDADKDKLTIEINAEEWGILGGMFCMIDAQLPAPHWEDSTGQADTAITPAQFDAAFDAWNNLLKDIQLRHAFYKGKQTP